ncbi:flagellar hook-associated protein FlgK [Geochorda subterranea]|uniref:Flagellar hook-associated protein 1 n=1 Tax=Geochorda subterranea TaxID=3109564 RepID=A0ABZ1BPF3_9FIRM|nr:flagellar hook-associated protein FlgK [Limnochorda sp. LNt]WRP13987.1 flagellar hook-associated protein FlgK [Limnochorda sp. LNt]
MRSTFFGIELARRALFAQQRAMDVASHNIANANDPAYSRQRAEMVATAPYAPPGTAPAGVAGQVGTGVWVQAIERVRDAYLDGRIRSQGQLTSYWRVQRDTFEQIERIFNEPTDQGIRVALDQLWQALQDLSVTPDSMAVREVVVQRGKLLTEAVGTVFRQLEALRLDLDASLGLKVERLNTLAADLARLNRQIAQVVASGQRPNDLLDRRDAILEEMAGLAAVQVTVRSGEQVAVSIGGLALVDGEIAHRLVMEGQGADRVVRWEGASGPVVAFGGGEIGAILEMRGTIGSQGPASVSGAIPGLMRALDEWTRALAQEFNRVHRAGYGLDGQNGRGFFRVDADQDGWVADDLTIWPGIMADPGRVAAAKSDTSIPGDGSHALALADVLKTVRFDSTKQVDLGGVTLPDYFASLVGRIGVQAQQAQRMADNQQLVLDHLEGLRQSISGVSLDEEMADLIRFEHAYGAAARAMTAMDEVLDTLINRTGLVGR